MYVRMYVFITMLLTGVHLLQVQYSDRMKGFLHNEKQLCELLVQVSGIRFILCIHCVLLYCTDVLGTIYFTLNQFMRAQSEYHRRCQHVLESKVAEFQRRIG